jgi:hypothetical protein
MRTATFQKQLLFASEIKVKPDTGGYKQSCCLGGERLGAMLVRRFEGARQEAYSDRMPVTNGGLAVARSVRLDSSRASPHLPEARSSNRTKFWEVPAE